MFDHLTDGANGTSDGLFKVANLKSPPARGPCVRYTSADLHAQLLGNMKVKREEPPSRRDAALVVWDAFICLSRHCGGLRDTYKNKPGLAKTGLKVFKVELTHTDNAIIR